MKSLSIIIPDMIGLISFIENKFNFIKTIFSINLKILRINRAIAVDKAAPTIPYKGIKI